MLAQKTASDKELSERMEKEVTEEDQPHGIKRWDKKGNRKKLQLRKFELSFLNFIVVVCLFSLGIIQQLRRYSRVAEVYPLPEIFNIQQEKYMADLTMRLMIILLLTGITQGCFQLFLLKQIFCHL